MTPDINPAIDPRAIAVLLHPHPDYGGNRFHPFVEGVFSRLPDVGVSAVRFDFSSSVVSVARGEAIAAIVAGVDRWPGVAVVLVGYSFGAGIATRIDDDRLIGWYLLAPPSDMLTGAVIGDDPRPKAIVVAEHDQFFPRHVIDPVVDRWTATTVTTAPGVDHFLGHVQPVVDDAVKWIAFR